MGFCIRTAYGQESHRITELFRDGRDFQHRQIQPLKSEAGCRRLQPTSAGPQVPVSVVRKRASSPWPGPPAMPGAPAWAKTLTHKTPRSQGGILAGHVIKT